MDCITREENEMKRDRDDSKVRGTVEIHLIPRRLASKIHLKTRFG